MALDSYIFTDPANYDKPVRQGSALVQNINDVNKRLYYQTTAGATHVLNFGSEGEVDSIYLVGTNIASYQVGLGAGTLTSGSMDATVDGIQYALSTGNTVHSGNAITLTITPTDATMPVRIYDMKAMLQLFHFPDGSFLQEGVTINKRGSITKEAFDYRLSKTTPTINYGKIAIRINVKRLSIDDTKRLKKVFDDNSHFVYSYEWGRWYEHVFSAITQDELRYEYRIPGFSTYGTNWDYIILER